MKTTFIYKLIDPTTLKIRYIGKADNPVKRLRKHIQNCNQVNCHRNNWLKKLKKNNLIPVMEIIEECDVEVWQQREIYWIKYYENEQLTNGTSGGDGLNNPSQEVRDKILKSVTGRKHTEKTKAKMSLSAMGNTNGKKETKSINQICIFSGKILNTYNSIKEASIILDFKYSSLCKCLRRKNKKYKNYEWEYV